MRWRRSRLLRLHAAAILFVASGLWHVILFGGSWLCVFLPAHQHCKLTGATVDTTCTDVEKPMELFVSIGESFFGYACCASVVAAVLLVPAMFGAHARSTLAAMRTATVCLVVTTMALAALCYRAVSVVQTVWS